MYLRDKQSLAIARFIFLLRLKISAPVKTNPTGGGTDICCGDKAQLLSSVFVVSLYTYLSLQRTLRISHATEYRSCYVYTFH